MLSLAPRSSLHQQPLGIAAYRTKQDIAYSTIKDWIVYGGFQPNERLTIRDLAARIGVSETPVRVALTRLASEGLVDHISHIGARVTVIRDGDIQDIQMITGVLQGLAAYKAAERITPEGAAHLHEILDELDAASASANASSVEMSLLNIDFHRAVSELSGLCMITEVVDQLLDKLERGRGIWTTPAHREKASKEHRAVLRAIEERRPNEARSLMEEHWLRSGRDFAAHLAEQRGQSAADELPTKR